MRPAPKMSLLIAEIAAVITMTLRIARSRLDPQAVEDLHEGLPLLPLCCQGRSPSARTGQHVEQQGAQRHRIDRLRDHPLRVLCLAG